MRKFLIASSLLFVCTTVTISAAPVSGINNDPTPLSCDGKPVKHHVKRALRLIDLAHHTRRFLDATPAKESEKRDWRKHRRCVLDENRRERISRYVDKAKQAFDAYFESLLNPPGRGKLDSIAACESGGDPGAHSRDGLYHGKYQFDFDTWASVGGSGDPHKASEREQDYRAALLYQSRGSQPWPVCG